MTNEEFKTILDILKKDIEDMYIDKDSSNAYRVIKLLEDDKDGKTISIQDGYKLDRIKNMTKHGILIEVLNGFKNDSNTGMIYSSLNPRSIDITGV